MADAAEEIIDALREVYDPCCAERGISVVDMGLIRGVAIDGERAKVELILTTGWCPFVVDLLGSVAARLQALPGLSGAEVEIVWDEAWTSERLSEDARRKLRFLPDPRAVGDRDGYVAAKTLPLVAGKDQS